MGVAAILVMWPGPFEQTFVPASIWNLSSIGPVVSGEKMFENVGGRTTDGRQSDWYTISSPMSLRLRWANKRVMHASSETILCSLTGRAK